MDAAHELGHLVLHWHHTAPQGKDAEREAQTFAAAFLMPRSAVMATAPQQTALEQMFEPKRYWKVSLAAYVYRLHNVGLLTDWHYRSLMVELSRRGFRTKGPHSIQRETSQVLNKVFDALRKQGTGRDEVARLLHIYSRDLDALIFGLAMLPLEGSGGRARAAPDRPALQVVKGGKAS